MENRVNKLQTSAFCSSLFSRPLVERVHKIVQKTVRKIFLLLKYEWTLSLIVLLAICVCSYMEMNEQEKNVEYCLVVCMFILVWQFSATILCVDDIERFIEWW